MDGRCRVREATVADIAAVLRIERDAFADPWHRDAFLAALQTPHVHFLVAERAGEVAGYVIGLTAADEGEIQNVAVASVFRRTGVGRVLVDAVLDLIAQAGARSVYLEVRASNVAACALYESIGFRPIGRRRQYYRKPTEDAIVLSKEIDQKRVSLVDKTT